jgi:hypothetical protein
MKCVEKLTLQNAGEDISMLPKRKNEFSASNFRKNVNFECAIHFSAQFGPSKIKEHYILETQNQVHMYLIEAKLLIEHYLLFNVNNYIVCWVLASLLVLCF